MTQPMSKSEAVEAIDGVFQELMMFSDGGRYRNIPGPRGDEITVSLSDLSDVLQYGVCFDACDETDIAQAKLFDAAHDRLTAALAAHKGEGNG